MAAPETRNLLQCVYAPRIAPNLARPDPLTDLPVLQARAAQAEPARDGPPKSESRQGVLAALEQAAAGTKPLTVAVTAMQRGEPADVGWLLADVSVEDVAEFARATVRAERQLLDAGTAAVAKVLAAPAKPDALPAKGICPAKGGGATAAVGTRPFAVALQQKHPVAASYVQTLGVSTHLDAATVATTPNVVAHWARLQGAYDSRFAGRKSALEALIHLSRIDPIGYRRGDLVSAFTHLPGETLRLIHREWSRTDREYTSLVTTSQETEAEEALFEKKELTESTTAQRDHAMALSTIAGSRALSRRDQLPRLAILHGDRSGERPPRPSRPLRSLFGRAQTPKRSS